ncbi:amidase [Pseudonocardia asaccharolytica]|nr:amidase [Pseudonocardia asaccharolytica]
MTAPGPATRAVERCARRIAARDDDVRAWAHLDLDGARAQAARLDAVAGPAAPLHGVTLGVKDIIDTAGLPTTYGSAAFADRRPTEEAHVVAALRTAGAVLLGKTVTTELATYEPGVTCNPRNTGHTPGGSSSGSAAAVADGQVDLALGTQTAGSAIRPASFCGVFALKPTYARWSVHGVLPVALTFDTVGALSRDPALLRVTDEVLAGPDEPQRGLPPLSALRVGVLRGPWWERATPSIRQLVETAAGELGAHVARVVDLDAPSWLADTEEAHRLLMAIEAATALRPHAELAGDMISERLRTMLAEGAAAGTVRTQWCRRVLSRATDQVRRWFDEVDVLLAPAAPGEAPEGLDSTGDPVFTRLFSAAGTPEVALPVGLGDHGLPLGLQLVGPPDSDRALVDHGVAVAGLLGCTATVIPLTKEVS